MARSVLEPLETFWNALSDGGSDSIGKLLTREAAFDDPLFGTASADDVRDTALPRFASWFRERMTDGVAGVQHLRTIPDDRRVAIEWVIGMKNGLVWDPARQEARKAERIQLCVAMVGDRAPSGGAPYSAIRVYFGTWSVLDGKPRMRIGPVCPDETDATARAMAAVPVVHRYFDCLSRGDAAIRECFEPDGYFREPANNYACGDDQLAEHFQHVLALGGVGVDWRTATRSGSTIALEGQTVKWGTKTMPSPQAGYASYDIGIHGRLAAGRVYDSVIPP